MLGSSPAGLGFGLALGALLVFFSCLFLGGTSVLLENFAAQGLVDSTQARRHTLGLWQVLRDASTATVAMVFAFGFWTYPQDAALGDPFLLSAAGLSFLLASVLMAVSWSAWAIGVIALLDDEAFDEVAPSKTQDGKGLARLRSGICEYCGAARSAAQGSACDGDGETPLRVPFAPVRCSSCQSYQWSNLQRLSEGKNPNFQLALFVVVHRLELLAGIGVALLAGAVTYGVDAKEEIHAAKERAALNMRTKTSDTIAAFVANRSTMRRYMDCVEYSPNPGEELESCTEIVHEFMDSYYHFSWYAPELVRELLPICPGGDRPPGEEDYAAHRQWYACAAYGAISFLADPTGVAPRPGASPVAEPLTWRPHASSQKGHATVTGYEARCASEPRQDYATWDLLDQVDSRFAHWQYLRRHWRATSDATQKKAMMKAAQAFLDDSALLGCIFGELGATPEHDIDLPGGRFVDMRRCRGKIKEKIDRRIEKAGGDGSLSAEVAAQAATEDELLWVPAYYLHLLRVEDPARTEADVCKVGP